MGSPDEKVATIQMEKVIMIDEMQMVSLDAYYFSSPQLLAFSDPCYGLYLSGMPNQLEDCNWRNALYPLGGPERTWSRFT